MVEKRKIPESIIISRKEGEDLEVIPKKIYWGENSDKKLRRYKILKKSAENIKGDSLDMSEARYLKQLIIKFYDERPEDGDSVIPDIFESFLVNITHVPSSEIDKLTVDSEGNEISNPNAITRDQLRALWKKYKRDEEVPYASWTNIELAKKEYEEEERKNKNKS